MIRHVGSEILEHHEEVRRVQEEFGPDTLYGRLFGICHQMNKTVTSVDALRTITKHMYIAKNADGGLSASNVMVSNIVYDMGDKLKRYGNYLMHASRIFSINCTQAALRQSESKDNDIQVLRVVLPNNVQSATGKICPANKVGGMQ